MPLRLKKDGSTAKFFVGKATLTLTFTLSFLSGGLFHHMKGQEVSSLEIEVSADVKITAPVEGRILLKGDNVTLIQNIQVEHVPGDTPMSY
ncbi:unnamed protein product [Darwinula stevensoni]|uniref:Uncharacterized protein n=1 Tax=Darwinula stevensoni TaxID=69355 RepID=A0A7R9ABL5_9CRUS|nr:unnamed protein product [Darwinula stevensoni]CAG0899061.1 unnamed protein product [Darwinula stevensoni]